MIKISCIRDSFILCHSGFISLIPCILVEMGLTFCRASRKKLCRGKDLMGFAGELHFVLHCIVLERRTWQGLSACLLLWIWAQRIKTKAIQRYQSLFLVAVLVLGRGLPLACPGRIECDLWGQTEDNQSAVSLSVRGKRQQWDTWLLRLPSS